MKRLPYISILIVIVATVMFFPLILPPPSDRQSTANLRHIPLVFAQGNHVNISPKTPIGIAFGQARNCLYILSYEQDDWYLMELGLPANAVIGQLFLENLYQQGFGDLPLISKIGAFVLIPSASAYARPGPVYRYSINNIQQPILDATYNESVSVACDEYVRGLRYAPLADPNRILMRFGSGIKKPIVANFNTGQILGEYDMKRRFFAVEEHPNGNLIVLTDRQGWIDEQPNLNEHAFTEYSSVSRLAPDLVELSPTLEFIRIIGLNNLFEGKYEVDSEPPISMHLIRSKNWIATASYETTSNAHPIKRSYNMIHPKSHLFWGLIITDYTTGNIVRHWYAQGGGLDSGIVRFDVSADGTKAIGKAAPEEFDINDDGEASYIENPYVYIFNLLTGQVTKADWGLEDGSDIEIVDSVNRVYCTLPSQQALVWFPMP